RRRPAVRVGNVNESVGKDRRRDGDVARRLEAPELLPGGDLIGGDERESVTDHLQAAGGLDDRRGRPRLAADALAVRSPELLAVLNRKTAQERPLLLVALEEK